MALKDILARLASELGGNTTTQRDYWVDKINLAARDIYQEFELPESLSEEIFEIPTDSNLVSLPNIMEDIRAVRDIETDEKPKLIDRVPIYHVFGTQKTLCDWRILERGSPTMSSWEVDSALTFRLKKPASAMFTITVTGKTYTASKVTELLTIKQGESSVTTENVFEAGSITSIRKNITTDSDIEVYTSDNTLIAEIPCHELSPSYIVIELMTKPTQSRLVSILFKKRLSPLVGDHDQFLNTDLYDDAIFWNSLAFIWAKNAEDSGIMAKVQMAATKARFDIQKILESHYRGKERRMDFGFNRFEAIFY